jgi:hypothetical protein
MRSSFSADFCKQMSAVGPPYLKIHICCRLKGGTDVQGGTPLEVIKVRQDVDRILTLSYSSKINGYVYYQKVSPPLKKTP